MTTVQENKKLIPHLKKCHEKINKTNHLMTELRMKTTVCKIYFFKK